MLVSFEKDLAAFRRFASRIETSQTHRPAASGEDRLGQAALSADAAAIETARRVG